MKDIVNDNQWIISIAFVFACLVLRWLSVRFVKRVVKDEENLHRRWTNTITNITSLVIIIGLVIIWLSELRFVALSIAAFAVALVVATREQIQCFLGAIYIASSRAFSIGDWIKVGDHYGEVVRSDWLTTTLLEVDVEGMSYSYTGRSLVIPNYKFSTGVIQNLNFMRRYVAHSFNIVREADAISVRDARLYLEDLVREYCSPFKEVADRYSTLIEKRLGIALSVSDLKVRVATNDTARNVFIVTIFCPTQEATRIEEEITEDFLDYWYSVTHKLEEFYGPDLELDEVPDVVVSESQVVRRVRAKKD
ncbi:mechanosensitive ion channel domain-containing protein [Oceanospirillum sanctuarii]|uniref:mechanosensitive ion channel domain-containing protein n=1 Tax=Oceanospirillum sanctuarii TaxID=1434821 RepID=UPI000A3CEC0B|nr:mechanosensitive ion channel domain-containing protein [Oceanospirillum sanctuarii]